MVLSRPLYTLAEASYFVGTAPAHKVAVATE